VRRIANNAVSPIMSTITELKSGAPLIRAMHLTPFFAQRQSEFVGEWCGHLSIYLSIIYPSIYGRIYNRIHLSMSRLIRAMHPTLFFAQRQYKFVGEW